ncbi:MULTISPECIES: hypothetical protein [Cellulophaga]|uniref:Uncharacterized protein n=1 Tax=Cellulophaga geojensis KL-A TaxID=1328323 RepID=A0ABN0RRL4_9FLAO|nr:MULTISPECIES: hypothetical protein [Cellulophaga]APU10040.1 hypothetical protein A5M85_07010 [Cellulophaga lytica]EWH14599.1 hypothetical protein KLA_04507 [Cellulophaga geojensis KL-A]SNQ43281.1 conserved hypothetical protein [Cellulophaga lytica]
MIDAYLENKLLKLEKQEELVINKGKRLYKTSTIYPLDKLLIAVLDRSLNLISGFILLIKNENFTAASHLIRCHLDNCLRLSGAWLVDNPQHFAEQVIKGIKISKIKDRYGKKLYDNYLAQQMNKNYPGISDVYDECCGFIHLSNKHILMSSKLIDSNKLEFKINKRDSYISDETKIKAIELMEDITKMVLDFSEDYIETKIKVDKNSTK